jgi:formylglycine-generating enzyme required for sulfatase activity
MMRIRYVFVLLLLLARPGPASESGPDMAHANWKTYEANHFYFHVAPDSSLDDPNKVAQFARVRDEAFEAVTTYLRARLPGKIHFYVYDSDEVALRVIGRTLGFAQPSERIIHARVNQTAGHEMTHVIAWHMSYGGAPNALLSEGLAVYLNQVPDDKHAQAAYALARNELEPLGSMANQRAASLSYPIAGSFAGFLLEAYGLERFRRLYGAAPGTWQESVTKVYRMHPSAIEEQWHAFLRVRPFANSIGVKLTLVPAGRFFLGSPASEEGREEDEGPAYRVEIGRALYVGVTEVTQGQWKKLMGNNPSRFKGDTLPVDSVSWEDAAEFCARLTQREHMVYRLPTEAEWEYACRAASRGAFCFGSKSDDLGKYAWFSQNSSGRTQPVGTKLPNAWGLYDMHGNLWEWCSDWYGEYSPGSRKDPRGPSSGTLRVCRGGCWGSEARACRAADRNYGKPEQRDAFRGFRVVAEVRVR